MQGSTPHTSPPPEKSGWGGFLFLKPAFYLLYFVLSLSTLLTFLEVSLLGDHYYASRVSFEGLNNGTSWKPFVYRVLVPKTTRIITELTPSPVREAINDRLYDMRNTPVFMVARMAMPWLLEVFPNKHTIYPRVVCILIVYSCLIGYIVLLHRLSRVLFPAQQWVAWIAPLLALPAVAALSHPMQYPYDLAVLLLSSACFYCLMQRRFSAYLWLFLLACLNKESTAFILLFFMFWFFGRLAWREYLRLVAIQSLMLGGIKVALMFFYMRNAGHFLERHTHKIIGHEWKRFNDPKHALLLFVLVLLLAYRWREKPAFLQCGVLVLPYVVTAYYLFGAPGEYRVFFDIMPLMILLMSHSLVVIASEPYRAWLRLRTAKRG